MSAKRKVLASPAGKARQNTSVAKVVEEKEEKADENALDDANISDDEEGGMRIGDIYIPPPIPAHCSMESKGPRLIIWQIVNYNFKSYAGKVTLGPFHHCFTSIIGPNGSGKSNVIDSMLFVFGYRANKIRCKKLSTLLHNSAKFPNMKKCSVAVYFRQILDRPDGSCEEVPNSEIIVERSAFHDNSSFYTINGRRVQFKEVAKLLKQHHVDLDHNRFLILQGEVESIAMMKPKGQTENESGMLEYLEDIVGTSRYKKPLMDINDRVDQLTEERTDRHNRCKLSERDMKDLEQPYNDAVDFLRKENEQVRTQNLQIQKYLLDTREKVAKYSKEHEEAAETLQQHDEEMKKLKSECKEKEKLRQEELSKNDDLRRKRDEMQKKYEESTSNFAEVQQTMTKVNKRRKQNKANVDKREAELVELHKVPDKNNAEIEECKKKVTKLQGERDELQEQLQRNYAELEDMQKPLIEKREKFETQLIKAKSEVDADKEQLGVAESDLKILKHEETTEVRKYESMKTSYEDSQQSLKEQQDKLQEYTEQLPQIEREIDENTKAYGKLKQEEPGMTKKMIRMREEVNEKLRNMQSIRSNNRVLDFLMRQKAEGKIPGILGRLGDLGAIDQKYDVAISTAAGGRLDNILVDTVDTAQECINQLKRFDVGRGSFIALEKVAYLANHSGRIQTPENVPRLYDLVRVEDERVLPAFYFSLRNTLVAQDLDQGSRIAYGARRYRVVTLSGNLIEISGAMSGGGNTQLRGKMGTKVATKTQQSADSSQLSQKALEDMQVQADELQSQINFNQQEQGRLEREIRTLQQRKQQIESETQRFNITMKSLKEQLPMIFKQLEKQKKRMQETTTDPQKLAKLEQQIEEKRQKLKVSEEAAAKVDAKIAEVQQQIDDLRGDKVKAVQTRINNVANQIKKLEVNISKLTVEVTGSERQAAKIAKEVKNMRDEIEKMENELKQLSEERSKHDQETLEWSKKLEEANAALNDTGTDTSEIEKEIAELRKQQNDNTLKRVELEQQIQAAAAKLNEVNSKIPYWTEKLKPLKLNDIPGEKEPEPPLKTYTDEELATYTLSDIQYKNTVLQEALRNKPNLSCIQDYIEKRDIYLERVKALEDITTKRNEMRQIYDDVRKRRYNEFMTGFSVITRKLKEMYQMITQGGDAELELVDSMDPFTEGVSFSVRPPKKTWKNISNLSGGEKTLSSLALVFALHYYKPSPLYFMDEIDAALDFKNISIVAHYIKERTKNAQFIIISLRSNMFELSDYVVGIYKLNDCTDSITIKNCPPVAELENAQNQSREQSNAQNPAGQRVDGSLMVDGSEQTMRQTQSAESRVGGGGRDTTFAPTVESTALSQRIQMELSSSQLSQGNTTTGGVTPDVFKKPAAPETTS